MLLFFIFYFKKKETRFLDCQMECFLSPEHLLDASTWQRAHRKHLARGGKKSFVCYSHAGKSDLLPPGQPKGKEAFRLSIGIRGDISNTSLLCGNTCYIYILVVFSGTIAKANRQQMESNVVQ